MRLTAEVRVALAPRRHAGAGARAAPLAAGAAGKPAVQ